MGILDFRLPGINSAIWRSKARLLRCARNDQGWGFTLIELLVVVAIIAVLVAILLPALKAARDQARKVYCANDLRQIVIGMHGYANDYNDFLPVAGTGWWTNRVQGQSPVCRLNLAIYYYLGYLKEFRILVCPADWEAGTSVRKQADDFARRWNNFHFRPGTDSGIWAVSDRDVEITSSYPLYSEGWDTAHAQTMKNGNLFKRDYFGVLLADGPWYWGDGRPMQSWHGDVCRNRGWNAAAIGGEVAWCPASVINPFWSESCWFSNFWSDNADIWTDMSRHCGYPDAYPNRFDGMH